MLRFAMLIARRCVHRAPRATSKSTPPLLHSPNPHPFYEMLHPPFLPHYHHMLFEFFYEIPFYSIQHPPPATQRFSSLISMPPQNFSPTNETLPTHTSSRTHRPQMLAVTVVGCTRLVIHEHVASCRQPSCNRSRPSERRNKSPVAAFSATIHDRARRRLKNKRFRTHHQRL